MGDQRPPLVYYVFDLLMLDGADLRGLPIEGKRHTIYWLLGVGVVGGVAAPVAAVDGVTL
jgi:ATP-dependent DNA ligase